MIEKFQGRGPTIHSTAWVHPSAVVIGRVTLGPRVSVWPGCVLRGDIEPIEVGEESNLQDAAICHTSKGFPVRVGKRVLVGHRATIHGAVVADGAMVGMGAILLDGAELGEGAILAAGAVLTERKTVPAGMLALGVPAKVIRQVTEEERRMISEGVQEYVRRMQAYRKNAQR